MALHVALKTTTQIKCLSAYHNLHLVVYNYADNWPSYKHECTESSVHKDDPDCCRCIYNRWNCHTLNSTCERVYEMCPIERQVKVKGDCCPKCLEENIPVHEDLLSNQEVGGAHAENWPVFECTKSSVHPTNPDCCRCENNKWNCHLYTWRCKMVSEKCPPERQLKVEGSCCPACLEENIPSHQSYSSDGTFIRLYFQTCHVKYLQML